MTTSPIFQRLQSRAGGKDGPGLPRRECPVHDGDAESGLELSDSSNFAHQQLVCAKERMLAAGWCCHQVNYLSRLYDLKTFQFMSGLKRLRSECHDRCMGYESCVAYNIDPATYKPRHATEGCGCAMIATPYGKLVAIIRSGGIPIVSVKRSRNTSFPYRIEVHPRRRGERYMAISHVWADGLGNPHRNALPACQIRRIVAMVTYPTFENVGFAERNISIQPTPMSGWTHCASPLSIVTEF